MPIQKAAGVFFLLDGDYVICGIDAEQKERVTVVQHRLNSYKTQHRNIIVWTVSE